MKILSTEGFLKVGGVILLVLGLLGLITLNTPNTTFYLTSGENWAHIVLGAVALLAVWLIPSAVNRWIVGLVGLFALVTTIGGFVDSNFLGVSLSLLDNIVHLVVGVWGVWSATVSE